MEKWLQNALDYNESWLEFQMRQTKQPGCVFAVAYKGRVVFEKAYGSSDINSGERLTPRHRFRVASHSKTFTAAAILKLRELGKLNLDDPVGRYIDGLHRDVAKVTLSQLLSHGGGLVRDGADASQWTEKRPFANKSKLLADLANGLVIPVNTRMKYSNHGFGLLGLVIEEVTGDSFSSWVSNNIVTPSNLKETAPDAPIDDSIPKASGHSAELPLGYRVTIAGDNITNALAPATGFVSTASDLVTFFSSLDPAARRSVLTQESRRAMQHKQWKDPQGRGPSDTYYGLGMIMGGTGSWKWAGHAGLFPSAISFTYMLPGRDICFSILTNALDSPVMFWVNGVLNIFKVFGSNPLPNSRTRLWKGRWWEMYQPQPLDLIPFGNQVFMASPSQLDPFAGTEKITVTTRNAGFISQAGGLSNYGEGAHLVLSKDSKVREVWLGGNCLVSEQKLKTELKRKYETNVK